MLENKYNTVDPFSGLELDIEFNSALASWRAVGKFWASKWYTDKFELLYDLTERNGVKPSFPRRPVVLTQDVSEPGSDSAKDLKELTKNIEDASLEAVASDTKEWN